MKASGMLPLLLLAASTSAFPLAIPQFWPPGGGGGGGGFGGGSSSATDVDNGACRDLTVIFARGTSEPGNIGAVIGPPLLKALQSKLGADRVAYQGVPYAADFAGNTNQGGNGGTLMTNLANKARQQCAKTKIVLSGYSQGGFVVHKAGSALASNAPAGAVIFGDPQNGSPVTNVPNLKEYCVQGDGVCGTPRTYQITPAHTSYGNNAADAANWIAGLL